MFITELYVHYHHNPFCVPAQHIFSRRYSEPNIIINLYGNGGIAMNASDRRVGKTRKAVFSALNSLLCEKKYANITVQDIIDRADIGRATFYAHFPAKDDALYEYVENFFESFNKQLDEHVNQNEGGRFLPIAALFAHIQENEKTISGNFLSDNGTLLFEKFKKYWIAKARPVIELHIPAGQQPRIPIEMLTNHVISTAIELIQFWLQDGMRYTPEEMEQFFFALVYPLLSEIDTNIPDH